MRTRSLHALTTTNVLEKATMPVISGVRIIRAPSRAINKTFRPVLLILRRVAGRNVMRKVFGRTKVFGVGTKVG